MTWTKQEADAWLDFYVKARQAGWKRHNDGNWTHPNRGLIKFLTPEVKQILKREEEKYG